MKFSACMLVSRDNIFMEKAVTSLVRQTPDEFIAYIDPVMLPDQTKARKILNAVGAKIVTQEVTDVEDHHEDVVHSVHRMLYEATYPIVMTLDDDDEIIGDVSKFIPLVKDNTAKVIGGVHRIWQGGRTQDSASRTVYHKKDLNHTWGSFAIYNRDIFRKIHDNIDHGYFWDWKIDYWLWRAGYLVESVPALTSIHNINPNPGEYRKSLYSSWPSIVERLDNQKLRIQE